jgi:hypothetical protein
VTRPPSLTVMVLVAVGVSTLSASVRRRASVLKSASGGAHPGSSGGRTKDLLGLMSPVCIYCRCLLNASMNKTMTSAVAWTVMSSIIEAKMIWFRCCFVSSSAARFATMVSTPQARKHARTSPCSSP